MVKSWLNGRFFLVIIATIIVAGSFVYTNHLTKKLEMNERKKVEVWVAAQKTILHSSNVDALNLAIKISSENEDIPIIETDEQNRITGIYKNLDSIKISKDTNYLHRKWKEFSKQHTPLLLEVSKEPLIINKYYYGSSVLSQQLKYFPLVQLSVVALFFLLLFLSQRQLHKSKQNRLWVGMAKETAHQLGTPISSLTGWIEILKTTNDAAHYAHEIEKDINRLQLISDRFGKIGSVPSLENVNIVKRINSTVKYIQRIAGGQITFNTAYESETIQAPISPPLFDWVIENLLKNALDAIDKKGAITISVEENDLKVIISVTDTGKGIPYAQIKNVFKPGYTTKKRGWGLGLALSKRIVESYHKGSISVKSSEVGKGTTFRIILFKKPTSAS